MHKLRNEAVRISAAILLPLMIIVGFQLFNYLDGTRRDVEQLSITRADEIAGLAEFVGAADLKLAVALASSSALARDDLPAAYGRAREFAAISRNWRTVILSEPATGRELFDLRRPIGGPERPILPAVNRVAPRLDRATVGDIERDREGKYVVLIHAPVRTAGAKRYILTVEVDPSVFQAMVVARTPPGSVAALVDPSGNFIARTLDYERRVGHPATGYVRDAVRRGGRGIYRGVTYEGLVNYTAYTTAPQSGWSAHVAIPSGLIDSPRRLSFAIWAGVVVGCLALSGILIAFTLRDIGRRRQEEERLRQSQKMEAVGQLTGGIAHDFNNLLTAIIGGLDIVLRRSEAKDPNRRYLEGALEAANRGAKLTSKLLAFSRIQRLAVEPVDIQAVLTDMSELLEQSLGPSIALEVDVAPDHRWVRTDRNQLELAFLNLALNARDAMPEGGRLQVTARAASRTGGQRGAEFVEIAVADTGVGMPRDVADRAFDPFFTTKEVNRGTGLGLAQVYAMAQQSEGDARIESAPGEGARVILRLPAAEPVDRTTQSTEALPAIDGAGRRILVLDDDDSVRPVLVEGLRARGFVVFEASNGPDALRDLPALAPDLLILDYLMPGMSGAEVARQARRLRPQQRIMFVSGHMDDRAVQAAAAGSTVLRKPFDGAQLAAAVDRALAEAG